MFYLGSFKINPSFLFVFASHCFILYTHFEGFDYYCLFSHVKTGLSVIVYKKWKQLHVRKRPSLKIILSETDSFDTRVYDGFISENNFNKWAWSCYPLGGRVINPNDLQFARISEKKKLNLDTGFSCKKMPNISRVVFLMWRLVFISMYYNEERNREAHLILKRSTFSNYWCEQHSFVLLFS